MEPSHNRTVTLAPAPRGFTLVEMLVVLAIIVVVTAIAVIGQDQFDSSVLLTDTAYTVALSVRQAQSLGISSKVFGAVPNAAYGVHFGSGSPSSYLLFADTNPTEGNTVLNTLGTDAFGVALCYGHTAAAGAENAKPGNCIYTANQDGLVQSFAFTRGFTIGSVCGRERNTGISKCLGADFASIDISFLRPNTQSVIIGTSALGVYTPLTDACIHISRPTGGNTNGNIYVSQVGEVAVLSACP